MIANSGYAKLIDCGMAKRVRDAEHTYTTCGTPLYLAPEVMIAGANHAAHSSQCLPCTQCAAACTGRARCSH